MSACSRIYFNPFKNDKILDLSKLSAFTDDMINVDEMMISLSENIVGKGENPVTSIFSFSHNVFKNLLFQGRYNLGLCGYKDLSPGTARSFQVMVLFR